MATTLESQTVLALLHRYIQLKKTGSCSQVTRLKIHWIDRSDMATGRVYSSRGTPSRPTAKRSQRFSHGWGSQTDQI